MAFHDSGWMKWWMSLLQGLALAVVLIQTPVAVADAPAAEPAVEESASAPAVLSRVGVIGASATCGFGVKIDVTGPHGPSSATVDFGQVLAAILPEDSQINHHGSLFFFNAPGVVGPELVSQALLHEPTLIVGIDYLFWYGYGHRGPTGEAITQEADRLALLEQGLKQLERFECPVVVGDFPNMATAVGRMLGAAQLPEPETLDAMNKRVREWAADRPNVTVFSLSELVSTMQRGEEVRISEQVWSAEEVANVIQDDQLHPTMDGLVLMAQQALTDLIEARDELKVEAFELDREWIVARLRQNIETQARELAEKMKQREAEQEQSHSHGHSHPH